MEVKVNMAQVKKDDTSIDIFDLLQAIENTYPNELTIDVNETNDKIEFHLDREFFESLDKQIKLVVAIPDSNKQKWTLGQEEVNTLKGLRAFIQFSYNGDVLVLSQDIRFPTDKTPYNYFASTPIPNPSLFSEKIIVQYDKKLGELTLKSTGGSISADMKIVEVKGIK